MHTIFRGGVLLAGALTMAMAAAAQQQPSPNKLHIGAVDVAATFSLEHAQVAATGTPGFWLKGGSADAAIAFYRGLGLAVNLTGEHAANIGNNVGLSQIAVMAGPRYTRSLPVLHRTQLFAEGLFGSVHAFDSLFPGSTATTSSAEAFSMQLGGGVNVPVTHGLSIRALEIDYVHTNLPNNNTDSQDDLRLAFGLNYRFGRR